MKSAKTKFIITTLVVIDFIVCLAVWQILRSVVFPNDSTLGQLRHIALLYATFLFFFVMYDMYSSKQDKVFASAVATALSVLASCIVSVFISHILRWETGTFTVWIAETAVLELFVVLWRTVASLFIKRFGEKRSVLIIENANNTSRLARKLKYASNYGRESYYYMIDESNPQEIRCVLEQKIKEYDLIFISPFISPENSALIMREAFVQNKSISVLADMDTISTMNGKIYQLDDTPVLEKRGIVLTKMQRFIKRSLDIVISFLLLVITSPAFLICAIAIKLDSPGPVIYKQARYTINKRVFSVYKFRTMVQDAEKAGAQLAGENDPRITKAGKLLRATRLDELPQLINILWGDMSIVGPRPERPIFADEYSKKVVSYDLRYCVKAGLTGYAQVYGKYNTRVSDKILMDMIYIFNYSILLDIKLILLTVKTMFIKSATEGVDEDRDTVLSSPEREKERRDKTLRQLGEENENFDYYTRL
ncbi:MAG: sugar transferase [Firmicutes bacterium]|nr:sugar transferase [Bacillota bacterium]